MPAKHKAALQPAGWLEALLRTGQIAAASAAAVGAALCPSSSPLLALTGVIGYEFMALAAGELFEKRIQDFLKSSSPVIEQMNDEQRSSQQFIDATRITVRETLNEIDDEKRKSFIRIYNQYLKGIRDNAPQTTEFDAYIKITKDLSTLAYSALLCIDEMVNKNLIPLRDSREHALAENREREAEACQKAFADTMLRRFKDAAWVRKAMIELDGAGLAIVLAPNYFGPQESHLEAYTLTRFGQSYISWISADAASYPAGPVGPAGPDGKVSE